MVFRATQEIFETFQDKGLKCIIRESDNLSAVITGISAKTTTFEAVFLSKDNDNDVALRIFNLAQFEPSKLPEVLQLANALNCRYRFAKFCVQTEDNSISIEFDFPLRSENVGDIALEMLSRANRAVDDSYPELMRCIWAD